MKKTICRKIGLAAKTKRILCKYTVWSCKQILGYGNYSTLLTNDFDYKNTIHTLINMAIYDECMLLESWCKHKDKSEWEFRLGWELYAKQTQLTRENWKTEDKSVSFLKANLYLPLGCVLLPASLRIIYFLEIYIGADLAQDRRARRAHFLTFSLQKSASRQTRAVSTPILRRAQFVRHFAAAHTSSLLSVRCDKLTRWQSGGL